MEVLPLKGYRALRAFNAFNTLLLGMKMLPFAEKEDFKDFYPRVQALPEEEQHYLIRQAALFVEFSDIEIEAVVSFCTDKNGVPYGSANIKNLALEQIYECMIAVFIEISKIKIDLVNDAEKKKLATFPSTFEKPSLSIPN